MITKNDDFDFEGIKKILAAEKSAIKEINLLFNSLQNSESRQEKETINSQINSLARYIKKENDSIHDALDNLYVEKPKKRAEKVPEIYNKLPVSAVPSSPQESIQKKKIFAQKISKEKVPKNIRLSPLEKLVLKRLKTKAEKKEVEIKQKPKKYINLANRFFQKTSEKLVKSDFFSVIQRDLVKTNIELIPKSYISMMLLSTIIAFIVSLFIFLFFMVFSIKDFPFISLADESFLTRLPKVFWVMIFFPLATFFFIYVYPSLERKSLEGKIDQELPFATIHMATIAGSLIEPSKIFSIIISTKEYPSLQREFTKLINFINVYGYDLVSSLRKVASVTPSKKLADLFNGLATTINSGGDLPNFFNKRSQSLLFDYKLEREKYIKFSETFMDIYISVVIAAPMMLMLILMIMKISGLGLSLTSSMISIIMVLGVSGINIVFLIFLHIKQQKGG